MKLLRPNPIHLTEVSHPSGKKGDFRGAGFGSLYICFLQIHACVDLKAITFSQYENICLSLCLPRSSDLFHGAHHCIMQV